MMRRPAVIAAFALVVVPVLSCAGGVDIFGTSLVEFRVRDTGCDTAAVTWINGGLSRSATVDLPWMETDVTANAIVRVVAERNCDTQGTVTVEIHVDHELTVHDSAEGPHATAEASTWVD
jgi:hypothetical protein